MKQKYDRAVLTGDDNHTATEDAQKARLGAARIAVQAAEAARIAAQVAEAARVRAEEEENANPEAASGSDDVMTLQDSPRPY